MFLEISLHKMGHLYSLAMRSFNMLLFYNDCATLESREPSSSCLITFQALVFDQIQVVLSYGWTC